MFRDPKALLFLVFFFTRFAHLSKIRHNSTSPSSCLVHQAADSSPDRLNYAHPLLHYSAICPSSPWSPGFVSNSSITQIRLFLRHYYRLFWNQWIGRKYSHHTFRCCEYHSQVHCTFAVAFPCICYIVFHIPRSLSVDTHL